MLLELSMRRGRLSWGKALLILHVKYCPLQPKQLSAPDRTLRSAH